MRHAYLITARKENKVLEILLKLLDSQNNDIYIHIDAKTKEFDFDKISKNVEHSKLLREGNMTIITLFLDKIFQ